MDFVANSEEQLEKMLQDIGVSSLEELLIAIPKKLLCPKPSFDDGLSEMEGLYKLHKLGEKNSYHEFDSYLGAGAYEHYTPAIVPFICGKSGFLTSYTPYQAEASQGTLQVMFEFQSMICALTDMEVANSSLYDGASACAEALLMAVRAKGISKVIIAANIHPNYLSVISQYLSGLNISITLAPFLSDGTLDQNALDEWLQKEQFAALLLSYPNFFGTIQDVETLIKKSHAADALGIVCANPMVYGLFASAGELNADIAVGDCQPFGIPLQYGGPYAGYLACKQNLMRQLPGRIVGLSRDVEGKEAYILTLQAREQHIRREKATSNICTSQSLSALASLVAMLWYGKEGLAKLALTIYQRTAYLRSLLIDIGIKISSAEPFFNEFVVEFPYSPKYVLEHFKKYGILPGVSLESFYPEKAHSWLVCVTETKSLQQLNLYADAAKSLTNSGLR